MKAVIIHVSIEFGIQLAHDIYQGNFFSLPNKFVTSGHQRVAHMPIQV